MKNWHTKWIRITLVVVLSQF